MNRKLIGIAAVVTLVAASAAVAGIAIIKPYAVGVDGDYYTQRLLSVGDTVPESSNGAKQYQMVGIPDGLRATKGKGSKSIVFMSHELRHNVLSEPVLGEPLNRGPIVSKLTLDKKGKVLSGERAYDTVYLDDVLVGPAPTVANATPSFARFPSGSLAGAAEGFANEESSGAQTFDGKGGLAVAVFDNEAHGLPALGHFAWENALVQSNTGKYTVIMSMEDGPRSQNPAENNSQLYMYVGVKDRSKGASVLERNGLVGGNLYVFRSKDPARNSEATFLSGSLTGEWVSLGNVSALNDVALEAKSDAVNAMIFARPEDGAFNPSESDEYFFVTTGEGEGNQLGRLYSLGLSGNDSTGPAKLEIEYNADLIIAAGGDVAISPDNIDASRDYLMIQEDGTTTSRQVMTSKNRDGSIWRFDLDKNGVDVASRLRIVELNPPGRDRIPVTPGVWETSGIIDTAKLFGNDTWIFDVQAHPPTTMPKPNTVEDGQLLMLVGPDDKNKRDDDDDADDNGDDD
ncbi:MAG TPA: alkaline phosphatase PhoX [Gaiellaceae bacterium]|nr:alkaline phosphatase PhoX [Gaiellaceae bacterium]